jgi:acetyl-CoA carboxylase biotin carboxyl carrier protein
LAANPDSIEVDPLKFKESVRRMDIRKIKKLIELLEESGIAEIEIKEGEEAVRISRMPFGVAAAPVHHHHLASLPIAAPIEMPKAAAAAPAEVAAPKPRPNEHVITAPMVGTFYASASPGAKAFIEIGDEVKIGQVLCIIEAMKMMNQIEADRAGRITSIMARNGDPVEFGQPLFVVE